MAGVRGVVRSGGGSGRAAVRPHALAAASTWPMRSSATSSSSCQSAERSATVTSDFAAFDRPGREPTGEVPGEHAAGDRAADDERFAFLVEQFQLRCSRLASCCSNSRSLAESR